MSVYQRLVQENADRAARGAKIIRRYDKSGGGEGLDTRESIIDAIADLLHFARARDLDVSAILSMSERHFDAEIAELRRAGSEAAAQALQRAVEDVGSRAQEPEPAPSVSGECLADRSALQRRVSELEQLLANAEGALRAMHRFLYPEQYDEAGVRRLDPEREVEQWDSGTIEGVVDIVNAWMGNDSEGRPQGG